MNTQDLPVKDQEKPFIAEHDGQHTTQENGAQQPEPVPARPTEQGVRLYSPAPTVSQRSGKEAPVFQAGEELPAAAAAHHSIYEYSKSEYSIKVYTRVRQ